jgi:hypothetical protein
MFEPSRLYVGPETPFEMGLAWIAVLPPTLTWLVTTPGTCHSVAQTLRADGITCSSFSANVAPVTVLRGSIAGVAPETVTSAETPASLIVTRMGVSRTASTTTGSTLAGAKPSRESETE